VKVLVLALLLLATPASAQHYGQGVAHVGGIEGPAPFDTTTTTTTTTSTTTTTIAAVNWGSSFIAVWNMDEASGDRAASAGSCSSGSDCDLTDNNTVTSSTTNKVEGARSATFTEANNEHFNCAIATCDELAVPAAASWTWGCAGRSASARDDTIMRNMLFSPTSGYLLQRQGNSANNPIRCQVGDGVATAATTDMGVTTDGTWFHAACRMDNSADTINVFVNGANQGGIAYTPDIGNPNTPFRVSSNSTTADWDGQLDECFAINDSLTNAEVCRICSCQIDGALCGCIGTAYADNGRNSQTCSGGSCTGDGLTCSTNADCLSCGGCTLPDCNAAAP
jgi:hypothetical protein